MDLGSFLVSLYVLVDDRRKLYRGSERPKIGRPALLTDSEVITLAILARWPRFRSGRDSWRFASSHLRPYFPNPSAPEASSTDASEPWSPRCALCNWHSPESSPNPRRSTASWTRRSSRPS